VAGRIREHEIVDRFRRDDGRPGVVRVGSDRLRTLRVSHRDSGRRDAETEGD
jgi:hypothetical protein